MVLRPNHIFLLTIQKHGTFYAHEVASNLETALNNAESVDQIKQATHLHRVKFLIQLALLDKKLYKRRKSGSPAPVKGRDPLLISLMQTVTSVLHKHFLIALVGIILIIGLTIGVEYFRSMQDQQPRISTFHADISPHDHFLKFRVRFESDEARIISGSVDMWKEHSWERSSVQNMIDSIAAILRINEENSRLKVRITGHADDTPRDERTRDEVNNRLARERHDSVLRQLQSSLNDNDVARIQFYNPEVQWWDVDGYDARHSPGKNSDFRVALIEITY